MRSSRVSSTLQNGISSELYDLEYQLKVSNLIIFLSSPELEVGFFEFDSYLDSNTAGPPALILPEQVLSQACRVRILHREPRETADIEEMDDEEPRKIWVTIGLTKVRSSII